MPAAATYRTQTAKLIGRHDLAHLDVALAYTDIGEIEAATEAMSRSDPLGGVRKVAQRLNCLIDGDELLLRVFGYLELVIYPYP